MKTIAIELTNPGGWPPAPQVGRDSVEPSLPPPAVRAKRASRHPGWWRMLTAFASLRSRWGATESCPTTQSWFRVALGILAALAFGLPPAPAAVTEAWVHRYSNVVSNSEDQAIKVVGDAAGDIIVTGTIDDRITGVDILTIKYSGLDGTVLWQKRYNGPMKGDDIATALAVDGSGNVVVTGSSDDAYYTAKYAAANGTLLWEKRSTGGIQAKALALDGSGNAVVTGYSYNGTNSDYYTAKYAAVDGALLWERRYNGPANGYDFASAVAVDASGNVVVTGSSRNGTNDDYYTDYYTAKYAAVDGTLLWEQHYNGPANGRDYANAVAMDSSGNVIVSGYFSNGTNDDYYTAKYAAVDGALLWERRHNGPANGYDFANAVAVDSSGNVVATGTSYNGDYYTAYTAKYAAADGALLWEKRSPGVAAQAVAVDLNGNVVVTGFSYSGTNYGYTAKYAAIDGALLWEQRSNARVQAVAVDGADNVVVTGCSGTFKYAATDGALFWEKNYISRGPANGNDRATAVAVDSSGNVVVNGKSENAEYGTDDYTAKYAASDGALLWERRHTSYPYYNVAMAVDGIGNVVVRGMDYIAKYAAADGALIWEQPFGFTGLSISALAVGTNGDVVVSRVVEGFGLHTFITKHASADGALLWEQFIYQTVITALAVDSGGNVVAAGNYYIAKHAAADGALLWEHLDANTGYKIRAVAVDQSGIVAVTGFSYNTNYTAKYAAADGALLWEQRDNGAANGQDFANAVAVDSSGNVVVTGYSFNGTNNDYYTAKYVAADGILLWEKRYNGPANGDDAATVVAVDGSGNVLVTGVSVGSFNSYGWRNNDFYTAKYAAADGALLWEQRYNGPANGDENMEVRDYYDDRFVDGSHSLALGPNGMVVITGSSDGNFGLGSTYDFATIVYREVLPAMAIHLVPTGVRLRFTVESGSSYRIERAPAVTGPWTTLATPTAPASGLIEYLDLNPPPGQAFYRTAQP